MYNSLRLRLHKSSGRSPILGWPEEGQREKGLLAGIRTEIVCIDKALCRLGLHSMILAPNLMIRQSFTPTRAHAGCKLGRSPLESSVSQPL